MCPDSITSGMVSVQDELFNILEPSFTPLQNKHDTILCWTLSRHCDQILYRKLKGGGTHERWRCHEGQVVDGGKELDMVWERLSSHTPGGGHGPPYYYFFFGL